MSSAEELMQRLAVSKKIMDRQSTIKRGEMPQNINAAPMLESFNTPQATYNLPQEFLSESPSTSQKSNYDPTKPIEESKILNSKLPDEIKKLMMEHPISQPQQPQMTLSNDLIERASRLMKEDKGGYVPESAKPKQQPAQTQQMAQGIDYKVIQKMINEAVKSALKENGLLVESTEKTNEMFTFKVGKHQFEGRVTKVKKLS
jgi:hypothetical protein